MTTQTENPETFVAECEAALRARRSELTSRLDRIEHDLDETPNPDFEDRASERETDEVLEDLGVAGLGELRRIDAALARIADGSFGTCARCGEEIGEARLRAVPATAFCRNCA